MHKIFINNMNEYINTWVSIQSIVLGQEITRVNNCFNKKFLLNDDTDNCSNIDDIPCHERYNGICEEYTSSNSKITCVNKRRIKKFEKDTEFYSKNGKRMKILETTIVLNIMLTGLIMIYFIILY
jgi:hypothetical protein